MTISKEQFVEAENRLALENIPPEVELTCLITNSLHLTQQIAKSRSDSLKSAITEQRDIIDADIDAWAASRPDLFNSLYFKLREQQGAFNDFKTDCPNLVFPKEVFKQRLLNQGINIEEAYPHLFLLGNETSVLGYLSKAINKQADAKHTARNREIELKRPKAVVHYTEMDGTATLYVNSTPLFLTNDQLNVLKVILGSPDPVKISTIAQAIKTQPAEQSAIEETIASIQAAFSRSAVEFTDLIDAGLASGAGTSAHYRRRENIIVLEAHTFKKIAELLLDTLTSPSIAQHDLCADLQNQLHSGVPHDVLRSIGERVVKSAAASLKKIQPTAEIVGKLTELHILEAPAEESTILPEGEPLKVDNDGIAYANITVPFNREDSFFYGLFNQRPLKQHNKGIRPSDIKNKFKAIFGTEADFDESFSSFLAKMGPMVQRTERRMGKAHKTSNLLYVYFPIKKSRK